MTFKEIKLRSFTQELTSSELELERRENCVCKLYTGHTIPSRCPADCVVVVVVTQSLCSQKQK